MSADIVGSTVFKEKHKSSEDVPSWLAAFEKFFRELPLVFMGQIAIQFFDTEEVPETGVWRVGGDEIVFSIELTVDQTTTRLLKAFLDSLLLFDDRLHKFSTSRITCDAVHTIQGWIELKWFLTR